MTSCGANGCCFSQQIRHTSQIKFYPDEITWYKMATDLTSVASYQVRPALSCLLPLPEMIQFQARALAARHALPLSSLSCSRQGRKCFSLAASPHGKTQASQGLWGTAATALQQLRGAGSNQSQHERPFETSVNGITQSAVSSKPLARLFVGPMTWLHNEQPH